MENTTHLFLATRFNCNKCHDHPFERWTQDQYFETAAYFSQVSLKSDPASGDMKIGGTAVEGAKPLYEIISDEQDGEVIHDRTGEVSPPAFPFDCNHQVNSKAPRRAQLASWITSPDNPYFASSYVNRLWGYLLGVGLIEPLDDIRAGNPPTNPQLLAYLESEFIKSKFDTQHILRLICNSRTYQLSIETNAFNADDQLNYSHALARRLPAEVLFDSIHYVTGSDLKIPGVPAGTRAAALPDSGARLPSGFLSTLGRPPRESVCECERSSDLQLGSVLALVSGPDISRAIDDPQSELAQMVGTVVDDRQLIDNVYLKILNRPASDKEIDQVLDTFADLSADHEKLVEQREARQRLVAEELPQKEQQRLAAIESAKESLSQVIQSRDPDLLAKEAARETAILEAKKALDEYTTGNQGQAVWLAEQLSNVNWYPVSVLNFEATTGRKFNILEDRSILLQAGSGKEVYTVNTRTDLTGVTHVRLELLPHPSLPRNGPGLAKHANLVLTELEIEMAHPEAPDDWKKIEVASAIANHEQQGYPVAKTFDGNLERANGWAIMGSEGKANWATYQLQSPIGFTGGVLLRFKLHQNHDDQHQIGRFRLSLSRDHNIGLGLPEPLITELAKPEAQRSADIKKQLTSAFQKSDKKFRDLKAAYQAVSYTHLTLPTKA